MVNSRTLRGDINAILNRLVSDGTIKGFSTNLFEKPQPEQAIVTVTAHSREEAEEVFRKVSQALEPLDHSIIVSVDLPDILEPESKS